MKEKAIMGFVGIVTVLLVTITLVDVIGGIGGNATNIDENNTGKPSVIIDKDDVAEKNEQNVDGNIKDDENINNDDVDKDDNGDSNVEYEGIIIPTGMTLATRINAPHGYERTDDEEGTLVWFLRNYDMKEDGAKVLLYDGGEKEKQDAHVAVFTLPLESRNLQQAADSVMRMYAEYYLSTGQYEHIGYHYSDGFLASYSKWREGNRISVKDGVASWIKDDACDDTYESFQEYMRMVFAYAGVWSLKTESQAVQAADICVGDMFLQSGTNGHVIMVVDECVNENGERAFLLAQGNAPAQEFHIIKNPLHEDDPWYYEDELIYPLNTPEYTFEEGALRRLMIQE